MAAKCPACGFESAEGAQWCDFCKEPFNKKRPEAAPAPEPKPATPPPALGPISLEDLPREALAKLPAELLPGMDGERIPEPPKWLKPLAYAFLGLVLLAAAGLTLLFILKTRRLPH